MAPEFGKGVASILYLGIDFGTTHSSITVHDGVSGEPKTVKVTPSDEPYDTILRTAAFIPEGTPLIASSLNRVEVHHLKFDGGTIGKRKGLLLKHFKPYFGRWTLKSTESLCIVEERDNALHEMKKEVSIFGKQVLNPPYSRAEIVLGAAAVLRRLKEAVSVPELGYSVDDASQILMGNPVGFKGFSRNRLLHASLMAGIVRSAQDALQRIRFVYEPVAVACNSMTAGRQEQRGFIFDFGGGTLDMAVVRFEAERGLLHPGKIEVMKGFPLAGHHIDWQIMGHMLKVDRAVRKEYEARLARDGKATATMELLEYVEAIKKKLSSKEEWTYAYGAGSLRLTRTELEKLLEPLLAKVRVIIRDTLESLPAERREMDRVITAGGSSLIPSVQQTLKGCFAHQSKPPQFVLYSAKEDKTGGDVENALVGVARGLSRHGRRLDMRDQTDRSLHILQEDDQICCVMPIKLPFVKDGERMLATGPEIELVLPRYSSGGGVTLAIYEEGVWGLEYLVQYVDVPAPPGPLKCIFLWEKGAFLPSFRLGNHEFDPARLPEEQLQALLKGDECHLSFAGPQSPRLPCHRVGVGDEIDCYDEEDTQKHGFVREIRHRQSWISVRESTPDLNSYFLKTEWKSGETKRFVTRSSKLRIVHQAEHHKDTIKENLFTEQLRMELETGNHV